jgi:hypothetical protein
MRWMTDTISALFSHRLASLFAAAICWMLCEPAVAQITYGGNGTLIGTATGIDPVVQNALTVPAGTDRLLLVSITRDAPGNPTTLSVTFNGQSLSMEAEDMGGAAGLDINHFSSDSLFNSIVSRNQAAFTCLMPP